jgi:AraC-like DNA-binding protein
MAAPRLVIEPQFSVELRSLGGTVPPGIDFSILHFRTSPHGELPAGASLLANPNQSFSFPAKSKREGLLLVRLSPELLIETAARLRLYRSGMHLLFRQPLMPFKDARLQSILDAVAGELAAGEAGWREMIRSSINQLAIYLLRSHINVQRSDEIELSRVGIVDRRLRRAVEFMHDHCGRELKLAEIAAVAYLSEFHFARLFKKLMGYGSQSHFTKVFREVTGLTPRAFRKAVR